VSKSACNLEFVDPVVGIGEVESNLHKRLKENVKEEMIDGQNFHPLYEYIRTSEEFKEAFGDWNSSDEAYQDMRDLSINKGVFNDQGEPQLHFDDLGPYLLAPTGKRIGLTAASNVLTANELVDGVNTMTGQYIGADTNESISSFVTDKVNAQIKKLDKDINEITRVIKVLESEEDPDEDEIDEFFDTGAKYAKYKAKLKQLLKSEAMLNTFAKRIEARLEKQSFKLKQTTIDKEDMDAHEDIVNFTLESSQISNRALDDIRILKFLSSVPVFNVYRENVLDQKAKENRLFGGPMYMNQPAARELLENILADSITVLAGESPFSNYLELIKTQVIVSEHAGLNYMYDFLNNLEDNVDDDLSFKVKFYGAMNKARQHYAITMVDKKDDGELSLEVVDPATTGSKAAKLTNSFIETIVNSEGINLEEVQKKRIELFNKAKNKPTINGYTVFLKQFLKNDLNLKVTDKGIKRLVRKETISSANGELNFTSLNELILDFISNPIRNKEIEDSFAFELNGQMSVLNELRGAGKADKNEILKKYLLRNNSFLRILADVDSIFHNHNAEATVYTGKNTRWLYSFPSNLSIELRRMQQGVSTRMTELADRGLMYVKHLTNKEKAQGVNIVTNTELKTQNDPNPTLHKDITDVDLHLDIFMKMFNSLTDFKQSSIKGLKRKGSKKIKELVNLSNYLMYNFGADKNSLFSLSGLPRPDDGNGKFYIPKKKELGAGFKKLLRGYVAGEFRKAEFEAMKVLAYKEAKPEDRQAYLMENLIPNYHYKNFTEDGVENIIDVENSKWIKKNKKTNKTTSTDFDTIPNEFFKAGLYHKLGIFSKSLDKYLEQGTSHNLYYNSSPLADVAPIPYANFEAGKDGTNSEFDKLMGIVYDDINTVVKANFDALSSVKISNRPNADGEVIEKGMFEIDTNIDIGNANKTLYNYIISSFLTGYELSNIFNGHISFYKQKSNTNIALDDFLKRASAPASNGQYLYTDRTDLATKEYVTFNGEVKEVIANTNTVVAVVDSIDVSESQFAKLISTTRGGKQIAYSHEVADGQGFTTPEHFRDVISRVYGWEAPDEAMYNQLMDPNHMVSQENIKWIKSYNKSFTPLKLTHFEVREDGLPVYLKYSVAPLFPALTSGTEAQAIVDQMKEQGVDQLIFQSGSKGANPATTRIHNSSKGKFTGIKESLRLNPFTIDTMQLKVQTQVPTKMNTSIALGNQVIKNILTNLDTNSPEKNYFFKGKMLTGQEIYDEVEASLKSILQGQLNETLGALGYDPITAKFNKVNIKRFLKAQMDVETEVDILNLLDTNLPLETIPNFAQRAFPVISKFINKNAGKVYTNGASVVQVANVGFDRVNDKSKEGIYFFDKKKRELTPPLPKTVKDLRKEELAQLKGDFTQDDIVYWTETEDGFTVSTTKTPEGKMRINKARILLPFSQVFNNTGLSYNEFIELYKQGNKVDKRIMKNIIGYRIPNQSMASIDSFEIVGLLPPIAGDQAIVYNEITAKTGSDFDIDKMYLMMPTFKVDKDWAIPEEDQKLLTAIEKAFEKAKKKMPSPVKFLDLEYLKTKKGNDILSLLYRNDTEIKKFFDEKYPGIDKIGSVKSPMKNFVLNNIDDLKSIATSTGSFVMGNRGERIMLTEILSDVYSAHSKRKAEFEKILGEKNISLKAIEEEYGYKRAKEFKYLPANDDFKNNSKNKLIELYNSIINSQASYDDLMSPLDNPIVKNTINNVLFKKAVHMEHPSAEMTLDELEELNPKELQEAADAWATRTSDSGIAQMFPDSLVNARVSVLEAKSLIAIMANNMTDLGESQKTGFRLTKDLGFGTTALSDVFLLKTDSEGRIEEQVDPEAKISKIVSYFMNAAVDAAKDDYIISGNFGTATANSGMMMVRMGIPLDTIFTIMTNETIMNYSKNRKRATAKVSSINIKGKQELDELAENFISKLAQLPIPGNGKHPVLNVIPEDAFLSNNLEHTEDILGFWHLLQEAGKEVNNAVTAMKSDSNGPGTNITEMLVLNNRLKRMAIDSVAGSNTKWFKNGMTRENTKFRPDVQNDPNTKFLGAMANNTLFLMNEISQQLFLEAQPKVIEAVNNMAATLGSPYTTDKAMISLLYNYLYPFLLHKTNHPMYKISEKKEQYLVETFPQTLQKLKIKLAKKSSTSNAFLNALIVDTKNEKNLIKFLNSDKFPIEEHIKLKESLMSLKRSHPAFIKNLIQYSYLTTGFKATPFSFHQFFPANFFIDNFHGQFIENFINDKDAVINAGKALSLIAMNNSNNFKIVYKKPKKGLLIAGERVEGKLLSKLEIYNPLGNVAYRPFVKRKHELFSLVKIDNGYPIYEKSIIQDTKVFKTYNYSVPVKQTLMSNIGYYSNVAKLLSEDNGVGEFDRPEELIGPAKRERGFTLWTDNKTKRESANAKKDQGKADLANRMISYGKPNSSSGQYVRDAKKQKIPVNYDGDINENTIAFVSVNGNNKASEKDIFETIENGREVLESGGTIIMDSTKKANTKWNKSGEAVVQEGLGEPTGQTSKGYNYWGPNPESDGANVSVPIDQITAASGDTIEELGYDQETWDSFTKRKQEHIITCN